MNSPSSTRDPNEEALAAFVADLQNRGSVAIDDFVARYPHLAGQIHDLVGMHDAIEGSRAAADGPSVPERLGDFRIVRKLAHGGMGEIYEAVQEHLQRRVAVKVIRRGRISPGARDRFLREQQVLARLHQTHIIPIHTAGEEGRLQYFVMPYIEGAALHHVVRTARELETAQSGGKTPTLAQLAGLAEESKPAAVPPPEARDGVAGAPAPTESPAGGPSGDGPKDKSNAPFSPALVEGSTRPFHLSRDYFRSVAQVMADAAEAVQHAHEAGVLHRDLKPSNVMVDRGGQCWIIDFGLARYLVEQSGPGTPGEGRQPGAGPFTASGVLGTPEYMAPEQLEGKADVRTDVWGLGVTLYELLTLRRAFDGPSVEEVRAKVQSQEPTPPRGLVRNVPADLAAICRQALRKGPNQRYPTARAFAEDLRHWLRGEPTEARPAWPLRRTLLWARRNKGWSAAIFFGLLALVAFSPWVAMSIGQSIGLKAGTAEGTAGERRRDQEREFYIQQVQSLRLSKHSIGWSKDSWRLVHEAAKIRASDELRDHAAATLSGLDVRRIKQFTKFGASGLAFDRKGQRLLIGGWEKDVARVWNSPADPEPVFSKQAGAGPVAFRDDTPLQLVQSPDDSGALLLWDVNRQKTLQTFRLQQDGALGAAVGGSVRAASKVLTPNLHDLALAADGTLVAAAFTARSGQNRVVVWEAASGKRVKQWETEARALAFSPDGKLLAAGDAKGNLTVWSLPKGDKIATLKSDRTLIQSLAFGRDVRRGLGGPGWFLAAGHKGGVVTIWDLLTRVPRAYCRGSQYDIYALDFSPDGTMLASAGRNNPHIWDVATGQMLLELSQRNFMVGVAFSPDGKKLAVSSVPAFNHPSGVDVYELAMDRGLQTLRVLTSQIAKVHLSSDGRLLAALSQDWQVAIWDRRAGRLLHVLDAPQGLVADNAALAFSPDGKRLAFSSGKEAKLWDVTTGEKKASWTLLPGLVDKLAFDASSGKLLLFRVETRDGKRLPGGDPNQHPRVCRIRELPEGGPAKLIAEKTDFNWHVFDAVAASDSTFFVVEGLSRGPGGLRQALKAYAATSGKELWSHDIEGPPSSTVPALDPSGKFLAYIDYKAQRCVVLEVPSKKLVKTLSNRVRALGPEQKYWGHPGFTPPYGFTLYSWEREAPLVTLNLNQQVSSTEHGFSRDGAHLAWGNTDGTVTLCDIAETQRRLAAAGLGW
jgi:serine/threonine protein kinase/WD40 repeat protein